MNHSAPGTRIAFQGAPGAFSEDAALKMLGPEIVLLPQSTFAELFASLSDGVANYALAPIENSLIGPIEPVVSLLRSTPTEICGEISLRIQQQLIGCAGAVIEEIEIVESHPAALLQCQRFFAARPGISRVVADDTAASVARVIQRGDRRRAAIAGRRAAELYGGFIISENLEDDPENYTRFVLLGRPSAS